MAFLIFEVTRAVGAGMFILLMVMLLRRSMRHVWMADLLWIVLFGAIAPRMWLAPYWIPMAQSALLFVGMLWVHRRFGLLSLWTGMFLFFILTLPVSPASWYAGRSLAVLLIPAAMAGWALWVILSAQRTPMAYLKGASTSSP
jgi:general stress protein CsbA